MPSLRARHGGDPQGACVAIGDGRLLESATVQLPDLISRLQAEYIHTEDARHVLLLPFGSGPLKPGSGRASPVAGAGAGLSAAAPQGLSAVQRLGSLLRRGPPSGSGLGSGPSSGGGAPWSPMSPGTWRSPSITGGASGAELAVRRSMSATPRLLPMRAPESGNSRTGSAVGIGAAGLGQV